MILFALLVAHRVNSNYYKEQLRIFSKVAFTFVMDYTSLTGNFETEDFTMKIAVTLTTEIFSSILERQRLSKCTK